MVNKPWWEYEYPFIDDADFHLYFAASVASEALQVVFQAVQRYMAKPYAYVPEPYVILGGGD